MADDPQFEKDPGFLRDLGRFLLQNRKWWLVPVCGVILVLGLLIVLAGTSAAPFIYSFF